MGSIPGSGRSPGEGNGNPLQYSCLENSMDRAAWRATVYGVPKSWTGEGNGNPLQCSCCVHFPESHGKKSLDGYSLWGRKSGTRLSG